MSRLITIFIVLAIGVIGGSLACNGYKAKLVKVENCAGEDAVIKIDPDFTVKLNKKCELVPTGCVQNKLFNTAEATYKFQKDGFVMKEGTMDLCAMADHAPGEAKDFMKIFGAPTECPVAEEKICTNNHVVDLSMYKGMLAMAKGNMIIDTNIKHDTGKSCFHIELAITK